MKLIHSGKVLKDDDKIDSCNIKPNDFLVVMIAKVRQKDKRSCDCLYPNQYTISKFVFVYNGYCIVINCCLMIYHVYIFNKLN